MYNKEFYNKLKQTNITQDREKTKERVKAVWMTLDKQQKQEVFNISDLKKATLERTCRLGNISAILATALAEVTRVDPYYLAALTDENQENVSNERIEQFLMDHDYKNILNEAKQNSYIPEYIDDYHTVRPDVDKPSEITIFPYDSVSGPSIPLIASSILDTLSDDDKTSLESMTEDDMIYLLRALNLRARFNEDAKSITVLLKKILIG
ncbi:MAG: hypothetical protein LBB94_10580 [Clostridiales bacterium]|jgi:hypothetical protein|nr:hypothetical protein [Clostridiales bacterium]